MARTKGAWPMHPKDASAAMRRAQALTLRLEGLSQAEIASRVGVTQPTVSRMIRQALRERQAEAVDELRAVEYARLEALHGVMAKTAQKGHPGAANVVVRASERRSRLMGLDLGGDTASDKERTTHMCLMVGFAPEERDQNRLERFVEEHTGAIVEAAVSEALAHLPERVTPYHFTARLYPGVHVPTV